MKRAKRPILDDEAQGLFLTHGFAVGDDPFTCQICGTKYNEPDGLTPGPDDDPLCLNEGGEGIIETHFAGLDVAQCCFGRIEAEIIRRAPDVLAFLIRVVERQRSIADVNEQLLARLRDALARTTDPSGHGA